MNNTSSQPSPKREGGKQIHLLFVIVAIIFNFQFSIFNYVNAQKSSMRADTLYATNPASTNKGIIISDTLKLLNFNNANSSGDSRDSILTISDKGYVRKVALSRLKDSISQIANAGGWQLSGNNVSSTDFIGVTNATQPLIFKTNSTERLRIDQNGNVRITRNLGVSPTVADPSAGGGEMMAFFNNDIGGDQRILAVGQLVDSTYIRFMAPANRLLFLNRSRGIVASIDGAGNFGSIGDISTTTGRIIGANFRMTTGAVANRIATSDASGNLSWTNPVSSNIIWSTTGNTGVTNANNIIGIAEVNVNSLRFLTNNIEQMTILSGGNVGIGRTSPSSTLDVNGTIYTTNLRMTNGAAANRIAISNGSGDMSWSNPVSSNIVWSTSGNSGTTSATNYIGTSDAQGLSIRTSGVQRVFVDPTGNISILKNLGVSPVSADPGGGGELMALANNDLGGDRRVLAFGQLVDSSYLRFMAPADKLIFVNRGRGIAATLEGNGNFRTWGNILAAGTITSSAGVCTGSDQRYKQNITTILNALDVVKQLRGTSYNFRTQEFKDKNFDNKKHFGFIAQELEQVVPNVVSTQEDGYKTVNYQEVIPILLEAIKEQQAMIEELKKKVESIK